MRSGNILKITALILLVVVIAVFSIVPVIPGVKWLPLVKHINLGLDLRGGVSVLLEAHDTAQAKVNKDTMAQLQAVLENRVNAMGVSEPTIQQEGSNRIIVELAGIKNPDAAVDNIIQPAFLEFKSPEGKTVLTGADLKDAQASKNQQTGQPEVDLTFNTNGTKKFADLTAANVGKQIPIYLNGKLIEAPKVDEAIPSGNASISGGFKDLQTANNLAILLRSGALPLTVSVIQKQTVGPTLGADSLNSSLRAGIFGLIAILIFMAAYYRVPGLVADFALVLYAMLVLAIYTGMSVVMTLPGIAGFLLSLGMAVDTNVIIFERVKEELRGGKTLRSSIDSGFKRALITVIDAHITTLIATAVLYYFGTGEIRGFAVTLAIGIAINLLTAITFTRWMLHLVAGSGIKNTKLYGA